MNLKDGYKPRAQEFKLSKSRSNILDKMPIKSRDKPEPIQVIFLFKVIVFSLFYLLKSFES